MTTAELMKRHGIERIVFVPATQWVPRDMYHAYFFGEHWEPGTGTSIEAAIDDALARSEREAA